MLKKVQIVPKTDSKGDKRSVQVHDRDGPPQIAIYLARVDKPKYAHKPSLVCTLLVCAQRYHPTLKIYFITWNT